jgi:hypothetical protein
MSPMSKQEYIRAISLRCTQLAMKPVLADLGLEPTHTTTAKQQPTLTPDPSYKSKPQPDVPPGYSLPPLNQLWYAPPAEHGRNSWQ